MAPSSAAKYEKDDFFDTMSCEALERMKLAEAQQDGAPRIDGRTRAAGQRKVPSLPRPLSAGPTSPCRGGRRRTSFHQMAVPPPLCSLCLRCRRCVLA